MTPQVLLAYGFTRDVSITPIGSGLINHTWQVSSPGGRFILQKINTGVFREPRLIAANIQMISDYLLAHYPGATFPRPVPTVDGQPLFDAGPDGFFRLFPFIEGSFTIDVVHTPDEAFEAARQFGAFTRMLADFPAGRLHETLPAFHDLSLRYASFLTALEEGFPDRIAGAQQLIDYLISQQPLVETYEQILVDPGFKRRVTHHDTKISNVLFDRHGKGICVIDLDTVMPGFFISDLGDMFRTYLSPVTEEESDLSKIAIREDYFEAILRGYLEEMSEILTPPEKAALVYAGEFMLYMQALRFLTDHLAGDKYYAIRYEGQNYIRALNQATLLRRFQEFVEIHRPGI
jgi:Ser/Thr protein kinase RdoA (MazF antagonist)